MAAHSAQFGAWAVTSDDMELVHASKNGDVAAFEELVKRYDRKLLRIAQSVTHNREDSQDAVQEAFLKAYQYLAEFREASQFSTWLIRITLNQSFMKLRKRNVTKEVSLDEDFETEGDLIREIADWDPNPEQLYWGTELREILRKALGELVPISRTVFVLRDIEELSIEHTATALNLSQAAVKSRLWRARLHLRNSLTKYFKQSECVQLRSRSLQRHDTTGVALS
jgi:RNA polymerase sigma-70 factor (ECF subfamily)